MVGLNIKVLYYNLLTCAAVILDFPMFRIVGFLKDNLKSIFAVLL